MAGWLLQCISMSMAPAASMSRGAVATRSARSTPVAAIVDYAMPTTTDGIGTLSRRALLALTCATPLSARAGRVEDMLATDTATMLEDPANAVRGPVARTVQTSKLGVAVRRAVVKSAQFDDASRRAVGRSVVQAAPETGAAGAAAAAEACGFSIRGGDTQMRHRRLLCGSTRVAARRRGCDRGSARHVRVALRGQVRVRPGDVRGVSGVQFVSQR